MPINPINFTAPKYNLELIKPDYSGFANFLPNAIKAYNQPIQLAQERQGREQENRLKKINAYLKEKYGEPEAEANIGLTKAQIRHHDANTSKLYHDVSEGRRKAGAEQKLLSFLQGNSQSSSNGSANPFKSRSIPQTGVPAYGQQNNETSFGQQSEKNAYQNTLENMSSERKQRYDMALALGDAKKALEVLYEKPDKAPPVTNSVKTDQLNSQIATVARHYMNEKIKPTYFGAGATKEMISDILKYPRIKDPAEKEKLKVKMAEQILAEKLVPEAAGYQLISLKQNDNLHSRREQEKAIKKGWPELGGFITNQMPREVIDLADQMHAEEVKNLSTLTSNEYKKIMGGTNAVDVYEERNSNIPDEFGFTEDEYEDAAIKAGVSVEEMKQDVRGE